MIFGLGMRDLLGIVMPLAMLAPVGIGAVTQLRTPTHPLRVLTEAASAVWFLVLATVVGGMLAVPTWVLPLWWVVAVLAAAGMVVTTMRWLRHAETPDAGDDADAERASAGGQPTQVRTTPPRRADLLGNGAVGLIALGVAVLGG